MEYFSSEDPAAFMIAGTNDWIVSAEHMPARAAEMRKAGIPAEYTILPGVEHGFGTGKDMEAEGADWYSLSAAAWKLAQRFKAGSGRGIGFAPDASGRFFCVW